MLFVGTPHAGWDYECRLPMRSGRAVPGSFLLRILRHSGTAGVFPEDGETCGLVTVLPIDWDRIM